MDFLPDKKGIDKFFVFTTPIIIVLVLAIGLLAWLLFFAPPNNFLAQLPGIKQTRNLVNQYPQVTPTPFSPWPTAAPKPIPHGAKRFTVNGGIKTAPQFKAGLLNPYDPELGETQTISINLESQTEVNNVQATMETDNQENSIPMKLVDGSKYNGKWQGSWQVNDTYLYTYKLTIQASNGQDTQKATLLLR